jgi:putative tryptophan/tyrosine transport system substrate-binding protein
VKRRDCITLLGIAAIERPIAALSQAAAIPVIGFLCSASSTAWAPYLAGFRKGLNEAGYVEGANVAIEYRWAEGHFDRLPELAKDLVRRGVAVLVATGGEPSAFAAKSATATVPIVFSVGGDPVVTGLVGSLSRPGGNLTGVSLFTQLLEAKRIELLHEAIPSATTIAILINSTSRYAVALLKDAEEGARRLGVRLVPLWAGTENDFEPAFAKLIQERAAALVVGNSPFFNNHRDRLVALSARFRVPTIYEFREFAAAGGLMSYGTNLADAYRQIGVYTGRVLKGAKPGELPVLQPTLFELVLNLKTAKAMGISIPQSLRQRVDDVIE